jgi:multimeric flavodoxin WrbA
MDNQVTRRGLTKSAMIAATAGVLGASATAQAQKSDGKRLIIGVACSPRKGMTTTTGVEEALKAASAVDPRVETKLLDLGGLTVNGWSPTPVEDDFSELLPIFKSENLAGLIIGSPVYFRTMSALCKAFIERLGALRKPKLLLSGKVAGALAVGSMRHGGQEHVINEIQNAMLCHEATIVGGKAGAFQGAALWNTDKDDITKDEFGMDSARKLGIRVAEAALR